MASGSSESSVCQMTRVTHSGCVGRQAVGEDAAPRVDAPGR